MKREVVLRQVIALLLPFIMLFGLYVTAHGEVGAGGGFQGGVIFASAFIIHSLVFGRTATRRALSRRALALLAGAGVLTYAGVGVVTMLLGGRFLEYDLLNPEDPASGQALGITVVELGVAATVAAVMITIYQELAVTEAAPPTDESGELVTR